MIAAHNTIFSNGLASQTGFPVNIYASQSFDQNNSAIVESYDQTIFVLLAEMTGVIIRDVMNTTFIA